MTVTPALLKLKPEGHRFFWCATLLCCVFAFAFVSPLHAQTFYGSLVGTVTDATGAVVPGAAVTLTDVSTNEKHSAKSDAKGDYEFVDLVPAIYSVDVEAASFKRFVRPAVTVEVNTTTRADARLQVGEATETVEVTTETALLQTDSGTLSTKVEGQQVQEMPLNGRNIMNLLELAPGVIPQNALESQTGMNQGNGGTNPSSWNGFTTNGGDNTEYMDGAPLNVLNGNQLTLVPTQDSTQEFSVDTNSNGADQGRATGGVINMTSRSGTNTIHGSVYEYFRNADLNANLFFNKYNGTNLPRVEWNQNQYGANIGAPIKRDKIFFFGSWEAFKIRTGSALSTFVPTADMMNGIFGRPLTDPNAATDGCVITHNPVATSYYPNGTWTLGAGCLDPTAQIMKTFWPTGPQTGANVNAAGNNYQGVGPTGEAQNQLNLRADYTVSSKQHFFAHDAWWHIQDVPFQPFPAYALWHLGQESATINNNLIVLGDTYTLSPKTVLDVRLTNLRFLFGAAATPTNVKLSQFGPAYAALQAFVPAGNSWLPQPSFSGPDGIYSIGNLGGLQQHWDTYGINGSLTWIIGRHSLKFGGEARLMDAENSYAQFATGNTSYGRNFLGSGSAAGDEFGDFLMGYAKTGTFGGPYPTSLFSWYQGYYVQDTWQVSRKLTVNLGLRYELPGGLEEKHDKLTILEPNTVDPYTGVKGTLGLVRTALYPSRAQMQIRHNLFAPRVGVAYRLDDKTVLRGGFGVTDESVDLDQGGAGGAGPAGAVINSASATFTNVNAPVNHVNSTSNPFPGGVTLPTYRNNLAFMIPYLGTSIKSYAPYGAFPYVEQWNVSVAREMTNNFVTTLSYVGTHAIHITGGGGLDEIPASAYTVTTTGTTQTAVAATGPQAGTSLTALVNGNGNFLTPDGQNVSPGKWTVGQSLMPIPYYTNFTNSYNTYASQHYNALQAQITKRFKAAGEAGAAFTWAKTIGDNVNYQDYYNHRADKSVEGVPIRLVLNYVLPLPFGQGKEFAHFSGIGGVLVSGWAINGITSFQHGGYIGVTSSVTSKLASNFGAGTTRANYVPGCIKAIGGPAVAKVTSKQWFNTSCFTYAGDYSFGNENANDPQLFGQGQDNWDIAAAKTTKLTEKANFIFKLETFNTFNRVQFSNPNAAVGGGTYGQVTSQANNPRLIQLSARVSF
jgi:hypothetical protein